MARYRHLTAGLAAGALALSTVGLAAHGASARAAQPAAPSATTTSSGPTAVPVNPRSDVGSTTTIQNPGVVSWVHFGDLHITTGDQQNYADFKTIIYNTNHYLLNGVNFALLPGDNANDDAESEYQLIKAATDNLQVPLYAIPGDHDHKVDIGLYEKYMEPTLYQSFDASIYHFVFLDVMSGISSAEQSWLDSDLAAAAAKGLKSVIFMHSYTISYQLQSEIQKYNVIMVDTGHTHTNQVANDGHTVYAATRSTGQISEGPVGFSIINLDNGVVSWKFKPLGSWPFVMITSPSDRQLMIDGSQVVHGMEIVRAKIWDDKGVASATYHVDNGQSLPLVRIGSTQMWNATFDSTKLSSGAHTITVNVRGAGGNTSQDTINVLVDQSGHTTLPSQSFGPSDNNIGAYTEKGLLGTAAGGGGRGSPGGGPGGPGGRGHGPCAAPGGATTPGATPTPTPSASGSTATTPSGACGGPGGAGGPGGRGGHGHGHGPCAAPGVATTPTASPTPSASSGSTATTPGGACGGPGGKHGHGHGGRGGPGGPGPGAGTGAGQGAATIMSVSGNRLTVRASNGATEDVNVTSGTRITKAVSGSTGDLKAGEAITVRGTTPVSSTSGASITASQIFIQPTSGS